MNRSTPGLPVNHQLPEFTETHVHRVSDAIVNPKDSIRKLLWLISEFSKVAEYKINKQKSLAFLCTKSEKSEKLRNQSYSSLQQKELNI